LYGGGLVSTGFAALGILGRTPLGAGNGTGGVLFLMGYEISYFYVY
jgi:hypothetical protein